MTLCVLCKSGFDDTSANVVYPTGLETSIQISKERNMDELLEYLLEMKKSNGKVLVHHNYRRKFVDTRKKSSTNLPVITIITGKFLQLENAMLPL